MKKLIDDPFHQSAIDEKITLSSRDESVLSQYRDTVREVQREDGKTHLEFKLLWLDDPAKMKNNYAQAKTALLRLKKKLESQPEVKEKYCQKIQAAISKDHIEKIPDDPDEDSKMKYFIPYFNTSQAKFRVVYNAAREYHEISLNGMVVRGPIFLQSIQSILFRFGEKKYGIASDISDMFFQIRIHEGNRDMLRILWLDEPNMQGEVTQFRFLVSLYCLRCIPSMAGYALHYTAERNVPNVSASTTECVKRDMFVDDLISGADTVEEEQQLVGEVSKLLSSMGFKLSGIQIRKKFSMISILKMQHLLLEIFTAKTHMAKQLISRVR